MGAARKMQRRTTKAIAGELSTMYKRDVERARRQTAEGTLRAAFAIAIAAYDKHQKDLIRLETDGKTRTQRFAKYLWEEARLIAKEDRLEEMDEHAQKLTNKKLGDEYDG